MAISTDDGLSGYSTTGGSFSAGTGNAGGAALDVEQRYGDGSAPSYWTLDQCKRAYSDYLFAKRLEIDEQQESRRYRHGAQWTAHQIKVFNDRKQPVVTYNRIARKLDGISGLIEKYRAEPRAVPRSPKYQLSADLATASIRAALERAQWKYKTPHCCATGTVDGIGGVELVLRQTPKGYEIDLEEVDIEGFFYDPRSKRIDFADASYQGCGKWVDAEVLKDGMPGHDAEIDLAIGQGSELTSNSDHDSIWFMAQGDRKSVRLVYICYRHRGGWCWALFTRTSKLAEGASLFVDDEGKPICSYVTYSCVVDHDGDRYGFVRNLKSIQDEVNQRRSKGLHELNTRRIVGEVGAFDDIEKARREAVRPDGVVLRNKGYEAEFDDAKKAQDIVGQLKFLEDAKAEIENFGPNPALLGAQGISNRSGRAINLMQQAGIAELGPFVINYTSWKYRVYRAVYSAIKKYWTNERWIRLTDDDGVIQFIQVNALQISSLGQPVIQNFLGDLDVDIVLDEGPDSATMMEDLYETLAQVIPAIAPMLSPPEVRAVVAMLIENSPLSADAKRKFRMASQQAMAPDPLKPVVQQLQLQGAQAGIQKTQSETALNMAKAQEAGRPQAPPAAPPFELPPEVQVADKLADMNKKAADAEHKRTLAGAERIYAGIEPMNYAQRALEAMHTRRYDVADLAMRKYEADSARQPNAYRQ